MNTLLATLSHAPKELIIEFIFAVLVLAVLAGLIWCIERWFAPIPPPGKTIIAVVLVVLLILWAVTNFL
jgi:preprotein translocase subunit SecE